MKLECLCQMSAASEVSSARSISGASASSPLHEPRRMCSVVALIGTPSCCGPSAELAAVLSSRRSRGLELAAVLSSRRGQGVPR